MELKTYAPELPSISLQRLSALLPVKYASAYTKYLRPSHDICCHLDSECEYVCLNYSRFDISESTFANIHHHFNVGRLFEKAISVLVL